jgi:glutamate 5-kinase
MATEDAVALDRLTPLRRARTVVVKIGTGVLTDPRGAIDRAVLESLANEIVDLAEAPGRRVALVSSGAIALGVEALGFAARPRRMDQLQACAAAGQGQLIRLWSEVFARRSRVAAQVLLTHSDFAERSRAARSR